MNKKSAWCWIAYAVPALGLLAWSATGHLSEESARPLLWIYGFPSTALVLPVVSFFREYEGVADLVLVGLVAILINGALFSFIVHLVRQAMTPEPPLGEAQAEGKSARHIVHEMRTAK